MQVFITAADFIAKCNLIKVGRGEGVEGGGRGGGVEGEQEIAVSS